MLIYPFPVIFNTYRLCMFSFYNQFLIMKGRESYPINNAYEDMLTKVKSKMRKQKQQRKQNLRQITYNRYVESSEDQNEEEYLKKTGNKWWNKFNRNYFKPINELIYTNIKTLMTSEDVLQFATESPQLFTYYQEIICLKNPYIFQDNSLRVVFRHEIKIDRVQKNEIVSYIVNEPEKHKAKHILNHALPRNTKLSSFHIMEARNEEMQMSSLNKGKEIQLTILGRQDDENFILKCLRYQQIWRDQEKLQIDKEIECWEQELKEYHKYLLSLWKQLQKQINMYTQGEEDTFYGPNYNKKLQQEIDDLKKMLISNETYLYFKAGYSDKISQELEKALEYIKEIQFEKKEREKQREKEKEKEKEIPNQKKIFDTDCKICFCTKNEQSNQVIYCDGCNTSFHQSCYGIQKFDKDAPFLCDVCAYVKQLMNQNKSYKYDVPSCQICGRTRFPMKRLTGHFYHVSCLILFNFIEIKDFKIELRPGVTHELILDAIIENQIENDCCQYCSKYAHIGMKFHCDDPLCAKAFHPICAYLNGCKFIISRRLDNTLNVLVKCRDHYVANRQEKYYQVFIRRFLCNYKNTCELNERTFIECYKKELDKLQKINNSNKSLEIATRRIFKMTKTISSWIQNRLQKAREDQIKKQSMPKKTPPFSKSHSKEEESSEIKEMIKGIQRKNYSAQN